MSEFSGAWGSAHHPRHSLLDACSSLASSTSIKLVGHSWAGADHVGVVAACALPAATRLPLCTFDVKLASLELGTLFQTGAATLSHVVIGPGRLMNVCLCISCRFCRLCAAR